LCRAGLSADSAEFGAALHAYMAEPAETTHDQLWAQCALELDPLRAQLAERWNAFRAYNLGRARTASVTTALARLFEDFALPAMPAEELRRITTPTMLIWGRHDAATPIAVAQATSERYGWRLHVIEDCGGDPPMEKPEALVRLLNAPSK
jgi:pimeloyl-ACP methyl ester carboxylesterase